MDIEQVKQSLALDTDEKKRNVILSVLKLRVKDAGLHAYVAYNQLRIGKGGIWEGIDLSVAQDLSAVVDQLIVVVKKRIADTQSQ